jgi:VIT1/CCC1 family predicted Fe2+/Mn2+ transporter
MEGINMGIGNATCRLERGRRMAKRHKERHRIQNIGWLRAAVLGANDGITSTASLILGVAAAHATHGNILLSGIAGLVAGSMSMATGEYVSVSSQSDTEKAALAEEFSEIESDFESEHRELTGIYVQRGLDLPLAGQVARKLMAHDSLGAHARDELGISEITTARPLQAALASACSFAAGAALPLAVAALAPADRLIVLVAVAALVSLAFLGGLAAKIGGAKIFPGVARVTFWSAIAMAVTAGVGALFGSAS